MNFQVDLIPNTTTTYNLGTSSNKWLLNGGTPVLLTDLATTTTAGVMSATDKVKLDGLSDTQVTQAAAITTDGNYPVLLAYSTATTAETGSVNKTSTLLYNPSTGTLTATKIVGAVYE